MRSENLSKQQHQLIDDFISMTQGSKRQAGEYLSRTKWNMQSAINMFFDQGAVPQREQVKSNPQLDSLFMSLSAPSSKNNSVRYMDEQNFMQFNQRFLQINQESVLIGHILINYMEVQTSGHIQRHHFLKLFSKLGVSRPQDLKKHLPNLQKQLHGDIKIYKNMYTHTFKFYMLGSKQGSLNFQVAEQLWLLYLKPIMPLYQLFVEYLQNGAKKPTKVNKDLWNLVFQFAIQVKDVNTVSESDGWPVFLDQFVDYIKSK